MSEIYQNFAPDDWYGVITEQARGRTLPQIAIDWFIEQSVSPRSLVKTWSGYYDIVLHDDVVFLDNGCFEFCRYRMGKVQHALTFVCWSHDGAAEDICAWQASTGRLATWLGQTSMLGADNLYGARPDLGLAVHSSPLDWFKADRAGVVVLDPDRAIPKLRDAGILLAGSTQEAKKLKRMLAYTMPTILVHEGTMV